MRIDYKNQTVISSEEVNAKDVEFAIRKTKLKLSADILATQEKLSDAEAALAEAKTSYPLDLDTIVALMQTVDGYKKGLDIVTELQKELGLE